MAPLQLTKDDATEEAEPIAAEAAAPADLVATPPPDPLAAAIALLASHGLQIGPALPAVTPGPARGPLLVDPRSLPPLEEQAPEPGEPFTLELPPRFAAYVRARAAAHGEPVEHHLATIVRRFWQNDDWRHTSTAPRQLGEPAGTAKRRD